MIERLIVELEEIGQDRALSLKCGLPALHRLAAVAKSDTGQAVVVRDFLLGIFNGHRFPLELTRLRGLDLALHRDCLAVLRLDYYPEKEVHEYLGGGQKLFQRLIQQRGGS